MDLKHVLAFNLRKLRTRQGLSQRELAERALIDRTYVSALERSAYSATIDVLGRLAAVLGVGPWELLTHPSLQQSPDLMSGSFPPNYMVEIPVSELPLYECGALVLSYFAYPESNSMDWNRRSEVERALCNMALRQKADMSPNWAASTQTLRPRNLLLPKKDLDRLLKLFRKKLERRLTVARVIGDLIGDDPKRLWTKKVPEGGHPLAMEKAAERVAPFVGEKEIANILSRVMAPSFPVVHVGLALRRLRYFGFASPDMDSVVQAVCFNKDALLFALEEADTIRSWLSSALRLRQTSRTLIQFEVA